MKTRLIIWLTVELVVASGISAFSCVLRRDQARAFIAWRDNPTVETKSELDRQRHITVKHHVIFAGVLFAGMAIISIPFVIMTSRRIEHLKDNPLPASK